MYCSKCGVQNSDGSTHCVNCGSVLMNAVVQPVVGQAQPAVMQTGPKTSGVAIASFVMGLLSFCGLWPILGLPAIICGIIALVNISKSNGQLKGTGFAVTGLVIPVVLGPMMLAILMPALSNVRHIAQRVVCGTNLKGLSTAMMVYTNDYDEMLPTENWCDLLIEEADVSPRSFICEDSDAIEGESCYAMNKHVAGKKLGDLPPDVVLFFETDMGVGNGPRNAPITIRRHYEFLNEFGNVYDEDAFVYKDRFNQFGGPEDLLLRHVGPGSQSGCNIAYADGHVMFVKEEGIAELRWTAE